MKKLAALLGLWLAGAILPAAVSLQAGLVSRYVWRGFDLLPDNHAAFQPGLTIDLGASGFSIDVWGSFALNGRGALEDADEFDVTLAYAWEASPGWDAAVGAAVYSYGFAGRFSPADDMSAEVFASLTAGELPCSPRLAVYYDMAQGTGFYVSLDGSRLWQLSAAAGIELAALLGFNGRQYIEGSGFANIDLSARLRLTAGRLTLVPSLNAMIPLRDEINEETEVWFGFSVSL